MVLFAGGFAAILQELAAVVVGQQVHGIDDRHHRVEARHVVEAHVVLVAEREGRSDRQRLRDARSLDQEIVEALLGGEPAHLRQQVVAQGAADAAVAHLDELLLRLRQAAALAHEVSVDVHLRHVVDDDGDALALAVVEYVVQQRRLAGAEEAREHGDGQASVDEEILRHAGLQAMGCTTKNVTL